MKLLLSQKNKLYKIIEDSDFLTAGQFLLTEPQNYDNSNVTISLNNSDFSFTIFENSNYHKSYIVNYVPGLDTFKEISGGINWNGIIEHFYTWIECVSRELKEPNYWERLKHEISTINFSTPFDNSKFSVREYDELKRNVESFSKDLSLIPLLVEQQTEIKNELERLIMLAKDLGKYDWLNLFIGTIISIIIQLNVTPKNAELLWSLIKSAFNFYVLK